MIAASEFQHVAGVISDIVGPEVVQRQLAQKAFLRWCLEDPALHVPNADYMRFVESCARDGRMVLLGAELGAMGRFAELGLLGRYVASAPTLRLALRRNSRGLKYHEVGSSTAVETGDRRVRVVYNPPTPWVTGSWHQCDGAAALLIGLIRRYEGPDWKPASMALQGAVGERKKLLETFFGTTVRARSVGAEIKGRVSYLDVPPAQPVVTIPPLNWREMREMVSHRPGISFSRSLRQVMDLLVRDRITGLDDVAYHTGLGPRTIQRQLADEGATFGGILQNARRKWAEHLLTRTDLAIPEVAARLSYSSSQHFIRAFKSWTGRTPGAFRTAPGDGRGP